MARGEAPLSAVFSAEQVQFLEDCAPVPVRLDELQVLGPVDAIRWKDVALGGFEVVAELWDVDDGALRFLELSIVAAPAEAEQAQRTFAELIAAKRLEPDQAQETKTLRCSSTSGRAERRGPRRPYAAGTSPAIVARYRPRPVRWRCRSGAGPAWRGRCGREPARGGLTVFWTTCCARPASPR